MRSATRDGCLGNRRDRRRPEHRVDVAGDVGAVAREGGRLDTSEVVDVGGQPLGDRRDMATDLVELDDAQRLVRAVVLQQGLEALCGSQVFEGQGSLAAVVALQHAVRVAGAVLLGVDACHNP